MSSSTNNPEEENLDVDDLESSELAVEDNETDEVSDELTDSEIEKEIKELANKQTQWIDIYKILVDTRKFEIENFWKRTVFFWGAIAILLAGYFNAKNSENFLVFVSYLGFFYNLIFSLSLRGSKYWQEHWEFASVIYERALKIRLFRWKLKDRIYTDNKSVFFPLRPQKISVSKLTMILSDITLFLWVILITKDLNYLFNKNLLHFNFSNKNDIDLFTLAVVSIPLMCLAYLILFLFKGTKIHDKK
jgi:hypothetical protein